MVTERATEYGSLSKACEVADIGDAYADAQQTNADASPLRTLRLCPGGLGAL
jgi:hypothetical protein